MTAIPETKETSLLHLCEFIEDCEFSELIVQILHLIGSTGPTTTSPSRYIRFIFNRVILENAVVRAAAVTTLGLFALRVPELRPSIVILLQRSLTDEDDEVRDRAAVLLGSFEKDLEDSEQRFLLDEPLPMTFAAMERSVKAYFANPHSGSDTRPVTFATLPVVEETYVPAALPAVRAGAAKKKAAAASAEGGEVVADVVDAATAVYAVPEFAALGRAFHSTKEVALTETEMEYVVTCTKHIFESHVVLQFSVLNTIDDQQLRDVTVNIDIGEPELYELETLVPAPVVRYGEQSNCFISLKRNGDPSPVSITCELHFRVVQVRSFILKIMVVILNKCPPLF